MTRIIEVTCCAACPYIRVNHEANEVADLYDYCGLTNGRKIVNNEKIAQFCQLKKEDEENEE